MISVTPIYEPKEKFKDLNMPNEILNYYYHNEVNKFKYAYRKDTKLNEDDPTLWWSIEKTIVISNALPNVINFYPVISEVTLEVSPIQNALNKLQDRMHQLQKAHDNIENVKSVDNETISLIQGTVDPGVNGGLPKYKVILWIFVIQLGSTLENRKNKFEF